MEPVDDINNDFGEWVWICFTTKYTFACFFFVPDDLLPYSFFFFFLCRKWSIKYGFNGNIAIDYINNNVENVSEV